MTPQSKKTKNCPSCGTQLARGEKTCTQCGKTLTKSVKKSGKGNEKSTPSPKIECPSCGTLISKRFKTCPSCKVNIRAFSDKTKTHLVDTTESETKTEPVEPESLVAGEEGKRFPCPNCQWALDGTEQTCPKCGMPIEDVSQKAAGMGAIEPEPVVESPVAADAARDLLTRHCPVCESNVPKSLERCPICNSSFIESTPKEEVVKPEVEPPEIERPAGSKIGPEKTEGRTAKSVRRRTLKSAKVMTAPAEILATAPDRTKGKGLVNGLGMVNGTGAVNGNSFVNGTGMSNGVGGRPSAKSAKRASMLVKWQVLAVFLVIVIILSAFVILSYSNGSGKFSVDGDFSEWEDITTYGTEIQSTAPSLNITEWAVGAQSSSLFFYFVTEAAMMSSSNAGAYYLFVDSDDSDKTGYIVESIGADYMLRIIGWDSSVRSTSLSQYSSSDQYNWNAWTAIGSLSTSLDGKHLEGGATMPEAVGESAKFLLVSRDATNTGSVSYAAPSKGGLLVVRELPSAEVAATGIISKSVAAPLLTLILICEGEGGEVNQINPVIAGATLTDQEPKFLLEKDGQKEITIEVDTLGAADGQLISAEVIASSIDSTFASVQIIGSKVSAYVVAPPPVIAIDGAFADWGDRLSVDLDPIPVTSPSVDIDEVGNVSTSLTSYFYVSVQGEICGGTFVPAMVSKPSGGGGGVVIPTRHTAEDIIRIYIDSDRSSSTGQVVILDSKLIGADQKIEVKGVFGRITSMKEFNYSSSSGTWIESPDNVDAAKDQKRIEIGVSAASLGGSSDIDFIVETTSWEGRKDLATFDILAAKSLTRKWIVDPATTSESATSLSCQRKIFFDGMNYWSFYFDGSNTVYKHSYDGGITWSSPVRAFSTDGVNKVSVWYDSALGIVYAVGDTAASTRAVTIQRGSVNPSMHAITWSAKDEALIVSLNGLGDKNTFISKDASGYLWVLSSNNTGIVPIRQDLSAFRSSAADNVTSWMYTGNLLGAGNNVPNCKGSIVPAGTGSDVFAIYTYGGNVASRKFSTSWSAENIIHAFGTGDQGNTDNAPPSVVVDSRGVVHVVYGTSRKSGTSSAPTIEYSYNLTGQTTFARGLDLNPSLPSKAGDYYPTISLETSTGNLYVLWLRSDATFVPATVMGRMCIAGTWSEMTVQEQTSFPKQYLTSAYTVSDEFKVCWQWTQNTTAPIQVLFDSFLIPEFSNLAPLVSVPIVMFVACRMGKRRKEPE